MRTTSVTVNRLAPWCLFVESNTSGTGRLFIAAARELGYQPLMLTREPSRYPFLDPGDVRIVDTASGNALNEAAAMAARERPIAGVLSTSEYFLAAAAALARHCGVPGAAPEAVRRARDKSAQRQAFRAAGLVVPVSHRVGTVEAAIDAATARGIAGPVVVKPLDGTGSIGVRLCTTRAEVETQAAVLLARRHDERGLPTAAEILIEEYVDGPEHSAEFFGDHLLGVTQKHLSPPPHFVEIGHDYPAPTSAAQRAEVERMGRAALHALGLGWGPAHIEFRIDARGPVVIEVNARLAGGYIPELIRATQHVDVIVQTLRLATGHAVGPADLTPSRADCASIRFITVPAACEGRIAGVAGEEEARRVPGTIDVQLYQPIGWVARQHHDFRDRLGHAIACAPTLAAAADAATRARDAVRILVEPDPAPSAFSAALPAVQS